MSKARKQIIPAVTSIICEVCGKLKYKSQNIVSEISKNKKGAKKTTIRHIRTIAKEKKLETTNRWTQTKKKTVKDRHNRKPLKRQGRTIGKKKKQKKLKSQITSTLSSNTAIPAVSLAENDSTYTIKDAANIEESVASSNEKLIEQNNTVNAFEDKEHELPQDELDQTAEKDKLNEKKSVRLLSSDKDDIASSSNSVISNKSISQQSNTTLNNERQSKQSSKICIERTQITKEKSCKVSGRYGTITTSVSTSRTYRTYVTSIKNKDNDKELLLDQIYKTESESECSCFECLVGKRNIGTTPHPNNHLHNQNARFGSQHKCKSNSRTRARSLSSSSHSVSAADSCSSSSSKRKRDH